MAEYEYTPEVALWAPYEAAQSLVCEGDNVIVAAKYGWKSRHNFTPKAVRVRKDLWDTPPALAFTGETLWNLVPVHTPYRKSEPDGYIWVAIDRRSAKSLLVSGRSDRATFYFVRDWMEVDIDWIQQHLIHHLSDHRLNYDKLPDRLW